MSGCYKYHMIFIVKMSRAKKKLCFDFCFGCKIFSCFGLTKIPFGPCPSLVYTDVVKFIALKWDILRYSVICYQQEQLNLLHLF
ncbi:hypothetical protein FKM82_021744 [Ascaphus truei]